MTGTRTPMRHRFMALLSSSMALLAPAAAWAQASEVTGVVKTPDQQPIAGVPVIVDGPAGQSVVFTDKSGRWTLYDAPAGNYSATTAIPNSNARTASVPFEIENKGFFSGFATDGSKTKIVDTLIGEQQF
ncbi:carboxypeptidase regulatory-like domain-containing protein [Rhizobium cremeum]|uniref:carboxypeptidase-like regulatory domain-containing protein n=1 Tax=Rhizobium cremeum TaxID=2813827 RepID=UPI001FCF8EB2|nr:carboxypeptidase-like regulatory domain-containing protein [Rhizobium cremeum]MCJ7993312.1 carboxypeptidase regulatory-like domain-containing protein [Rhizobium cremeum]MCJ7998377.1 carboxypeptidase regulatory-like domain-containing protein [Rhizobium cremeum]